LRGVGFTDRDEHVARQRVDPPVAFPTFPPVRGLGVQGHPSRRLSRRQLTHPTPTYLAASCY
jgi:hypothetical protein